MIRLSVYYNAPVDPDAFLSHYETTHVPTASKIPGLVSYVWGKALATTTGEPAPYFLTAEMTFESMETLGAGFASPEGEAAAADVANFATGGVSMVISDSIAAPV